MSLLNQWLTFMGYSLSQTKPVPHELNEEICGSRFVEQRSFFDVGRLQKGLTGVVALTYLTSERFEKICCCLATGHKKIDNISKPPGKTQSDK